MFTPLFVPTFLFLSNEPVLDRRRADSQCNI